MTNEKYWQRRSEQIAELQYHKSDSYIKRLESQYNKTLKSIQKEISSFYAQYADNNGISFEEAKKILTDEELSKFKISLEKYKELALDKSNEKYLDNLYMKSRISRLEALKVQVQMNVRALGENQQTQMSDLLKESYTDTYYRNVYEVEKNIGLHTNFARFSENQVETIISKPWLSENFSSRIWSDKEKLIRELETNLTQGMIMGKSMSQIADTISKKMGVSFGRAKTLVNTEMAYISEQATLRSYKETGVQYYGLLVSLDLRTSDICQDIDARLGNEKFKVSEARVGINWPPFHPNCRTTTYPKVLDEFDIDSKKLAVDKDGKRILVPMDMSYKNWYRKYIDPKVNLANILELPTLLKKLNGIINQNEITAKTEKFINSNLDDSNIEIDYNSKKPLYYSIDDDKIIINPKHSQFNDYDAIKSLVHETTHMLDVNNSISIDLRNDISKALEDAKKILLDEKYIDILIKFEDNMSISDIFSCVTDNNLYGNYMHSDEYWSRMGNKEREIIANLYTEYIVEDKESLDFINSILPLKELLGKVVEVYEHI